MTESGKNKSLYDELHTEAERRRDNEYIEATTMMADLYENKLPAQFEKYFPSGAIKHTVGLIKLAWNDLATSVGRRPDMRMDALNESDAEEQRVGLLERVANGYLNRAEPHGDVFMWLLGWWLVGTGRAVVIVRPGKDREDQPFPILSIRDPRTAMPTMETVNNIPTKIYDILFEYEIPERTAIKMGLAEDEGSSGFPTAGPYSGDSRTVKVHEFIDDQQWVIVSEQGYYQRDMHKLGRVPGWVFQTFAPNSNFGLSLFKDQVSMQVAVSQLVSLKLAATDRNVNPVYWVKGHRGTLKIGPNVINKLSGTGEIGTISPPQVPQVDRDIDQLMQMSRILNRNPEVRQGEVQAKGSYTSAKTLDQLAESIDTVIGQNWDLVGVGMEHMIAACYMMDETLWPDVRKHITTNIKNKERRDSYKPSADINGRRFLHVDYGFGLGGFQGFLQELQSHSAGMKSRKTVMETMPGVSDVDKELRQMELEAMDAAGTAALQAQANSGQLDIISWSKMREKMANEGISLHQAALEMQEELMEQAQQAMEQGGADALTVAPPPGEAPVEEQPLPDLPPAALVG